MGRNLLSEAGVAGGAGGRRGVMSFTLVVMGML